MTKDPLSAFNALPKRVLLDNALRNGRTQVFENPTKFLTCTDPDTFFETLEEIDALRSAGKHLVGFLSYEAGYILEPTLSEWLPKNRDAPLLCFAAFDKPDELAGQERDFYFDSAEPARLPDLEARMDRATYMKNVEAIRELIVAGDIYQANFTYLAELGLTGSPFDLFTTLRQSQPVPHGALIEADDWAVLSMSPELFFKIEDGRIDARPMKGTAARAMTWEDDKSVRESLILDEKERAENLMILDLIRNDLSKIASPGSVSVPSRFDVETFRTIHQMTSSVTAKVRPDASTRDILAALFPCGSITGAPKIRAMEIIRDFEAEPRGVYTGAIGVLGPDGQADFNVAIRTLTMTRKDDHNWTGTVGVGGGIVFDSTPQGEWHECELKLSFLTNPQTATRFDLIESLLWTQDAGLHDLDRHLNRLQASADYFDFAFNDEEIRQALRRFTSQHCRNRHKVRLLLSEDGTVSLSQSEISDTEIEHWRYCIADQTVDSHDPHRYHKTTNRNLLDDTRERMQCGLGCDEVIFTNERGELTEGSYTNLFIVRGNRWLTPRLDCGLLNGVLREKLMGDPTLNIEEAILTAEDLRLADRVYLGNSVRGLILAQPVQPSELMVGQ